VPKRPVVYAPRALADREDIQHAGIEVWGEIRAHAYVAEIDRACARIGDFPSIGKMRDDIRPGIRMFPVEEHVVYYRIRVDESIRICRILHARQNASVASGLDDIV
jgi:toxin ParE1/3/4